ncbi:purine and uridine phosphorylase [Neurospora crassa]|nr:purine and uridine phosphorylase [Neurospora crassa]
MATGRTHNPRSHSDYTIGWVCALAHERAAAMAMLDVEHGPLAQRSNDTNSYTLGSIAEHNIVITCLPMGEIGTTAATTVVERMLSTFPSIRFGLMVGVGGGMPPKVRLGDVVVSVPSSHYHGVVQWDMGKTIQGPRAGHESFERTGSLNRPPHLLLVAVNHLKAQHELGKSRINTFLEQLECTSPMMASRYLRSDALKDEDDGDCRFCDPTKIIKRKSRKEPIQIHYGLIVSGNQVIKNAFSRDKLNAEFGGHVLCIEMEAAGLMNNFPCLVIRGICDYADTHKNKRWQRHAAAVAAAYAKELLHVVQPVEVNGERAACDIIKEVEQKVVETAENVNYLKRGLQRREDLDVLDWLTPMNFGSQHSVYRDKQQRGTGAGKTILSSIVIEDLKNLSHSPAGETEAAYIYCDYRRQGEQTALKLLSSLTKQLCLSKEFLSPGVEVLLSKHKSKSTRPSLQEVTQALKDVIKNFTRVYVVVDALDELLDDEDHRNAFVDGLQNLGQSSSNLKLFITSRPFFRDTDINQFFDDAAKVEISANQDDLGRYLDGRFSKMPLSSPLRANEVLQQEVKDTISQAARGMFLLAQLYMDSLRDKSTPKEVRDVLQGMQHQDNISKNLSVEERLDKAYGETMTRIDKQELGFRDRAMQILLWITHAKRPLSTDELRHALAVEVGSNELDEDNLVASLDVSICAGLAMVDDKTQEVRLVHYTTQKYLEQRHFKLSWSINPHNTITEVCVTYLMYSIFKSGPCTLEDQYLERISKYSLYLYAAEYWGEHAHLCSEASELLLDFLQCEEAKRAAKQAQYVKRWGLFDWKKNHGNIYTPPSAFHLAVTYGLHKAAEALPERSEDLNALYEHKTPLYMALSRRDVAMARILLHKGAQVRVLGGTPVLEAFLAKRYDHTKIDVSMVEDLLNNGAVIANAKGDCPLLFAAARSGQEQLVALLVQRGADPKSLGEEYYRWKSDKISPLFAAVHEGHIGTAKTLWKFGADPNRRCSNLYDRSALHEAVEKGHEQLVEMFLGIEDGVELTISKNSSLDISCVESRDYGLKVETYDLAGRCISIPAQIAADIESKNSFGQTPLALATCLGYLRIVGILNGRDQTPLEVALDINNQHIVHALCKAGADVESTDSHGRKHLEYAISKGAVGCLKVLLEYGARTDTATFDLQTLYDEEDER